MNQSLLAVYAHPDDEAFGSGGTIARYAAEGFCTYLVCATRGEVGEISDPSLATPETLGAVREGELRCAAETMGVAELIFLDYRDSGMVGTSENEDPRAFVNAPAEAVVQQLVSILRRLRPQPLRQRRECQMARAVRRRVSGLVRSGSLPPPRHRQPPKPCRVAPFPSG